MKQSSNAIHKSVDDAVIWQLQIVILKLNLLQKLNFLKFKIVLLIQFV